MRRNWDEVRCNESLIASHLIPKRMGTDGAKEVVTRFVGAQAAITDSSIGVLLALVFTDSTKYRGPTLQPFGYVGR